MESNISLESISRTVTFTYAGKITDREGIEKLINYVATQIGTGHSSVTNSLDYDGPDNSNATIHIGFTINFVIS